MDQTLEFPYPAPIANASIRLHLDPSHPAFPGLVLQLGLTADGWLDVSEVQVLPGGWVRAHYLHMPNLDVDGSVYPTERVDILVRTEHVVAISSHLGLRGAPPNNTDDYERAEVAEELEQLNAGFRSTARRPDGK